MNTKTEINSSFSNIDLNDDDFIFNNNEDESTVINPTKYNEDPFMSLKKNYVEKVETRNSSGFIKVFTLIFMLMLAGWIAFVVYTSYNPEIITGKDSKGKFGLSPNKVEAKPNNSGSENQNNQ